MSYFLFGSFNAMYDKEQLQQVKSYGERNDIYLWLDDEITFYEEIQRMLKEQESEGDIKFAITSKNQPRNSSDVLFPFDKVNNDVLFEDGSRRFYKKCCKENIDILFNFLSDLFHLLHISTVEVFVVEGYDDMFQQKKCGVEEMKRDILSQVEDKVSIDSCIYYVSL